MNKESLFEELSNEHKGIPESTEVQPKRQPKFDDKGNTFFNDIQNNKGEQS